MGQTKVEANQLLQGAFAGNDESSVKLAIEKGADVNYKFPGGAQPLHSAISKGYVHIVKLLLAKQAEVNICDEEGFTPLMVAALNGESKIVGLLLESGAKTETTRLDTGETALHLSVNSNSLKTTTALLEGGSDVSASTNDDGSTALHLAAEWGNEKSVDAILSHPLTEKEHVLAKNSKGQTASEIALLHGHADLANRLDVWVAPKSEAEKLMISALLTSDLDKLNEALKAGADPNLLTPRGDRPLHTAAMKGNKLIIQRLLQEGAEKDASDSDGYTPLMIAVLNGHLEAVKELLNYGSNLNLSRPKIEEDREAEGGETSLHMAVASGSRIVIQTLLDGGADVNAKCNRGYTPLHYAVKFRDVVIAQELLKHPDCHPAEMNKHYLTPKAMATELKFNDILNLFNAEHNNKTDASSDAPTPAHGAYQNIVSKDGSLSLKIISGKEKGPSDDIYKNTTFPRGHVLIINYAKFKDDSQFRHASSTDVINLNNLFKNMGYDVQSHKNLSNNETREKLKEFSQDEKTKKGDSVFVCMMSHGLDGRTFLTSDDETITVDEIYDVFKSSKCPHLQGKPKIFLFNFCRGNTWEKRARTLSCDSTAPTASLSTDSKAINREKENEESLSKKEAEAPRDQLTVFAATEGIMALRDARYNTGTYFIRSLCQIFARFAFNYDILELIGKLSVHMERERFTTPAMEAIHFVKKLYLNPKALETSTRM